MTAAARREQLLDECAAVVDRDGFHAVSIERVAAACGVTRTVLYQQFGSLDGMLDALVERSSARAAAALVDDDDTGPSIVATMRRVLDAVTADPATWRMFLVAPQVGPPALVEHLEAGRDLIRDRSVAAIGRREHGPSDDPELEARMLQAVADELVRLHLADPDRYPPERILEFLGREEAAFAGRRGRRVDRGRHG